VQYIMMNQCYILGIPKQNFWQAKLMWFLKYHEHLLIKDTLTMFNIVQLKNTLEDPLSFLCYIIRYDRLGRTQMIVAKQCFLQLLHL